MGRYSVHTPLCYLRSLSAWVCMSIRLPMFSSLVIFYDREIGCLWWRLFTCAQFSLSSMNLTLLRLDYLRPRCVQTLNCQSCIAIRAAHHVNVVDKVHSMTHDRPTVSHDVVTKQSSVGPDHRRLNIHPCGWFKYSPVRAVANVRNTTTPTTPTIHSISM